MSDVSVRPVEADAFGKVEAHGIDAIPAPERHGRPRELAGLWAGAFVNYASLFTASLLTTYYGLGVWDGLAATALGTVAAALVLGLLSNTGPRTGLPQIVFTRRVFGVRGSYVGAGLTLFLAVGWFAVDCVIAAQAGAQLFGGGNRWLTFGLVIVIAAVSVAVAVFGHQTIKVLETFGAVTFAALCALLFLLLAPQFHWGQGPSASGSDYAGAFVLGFMTCFAATCVATVYHYALGWPAPYPFWSLPVLLGTLGGIGLMIGPAGLLWLKERRDSALTADSQTGMDVAFLVLLFIVSLTGLLLLVLRETAAMGTLLAVHLGAVMGLFITMPYGKFVHAIYRFAALVRFHVERRRPSPGLSAE